jgi:NAD(P)-dependent dehydrogenase (short-subunit alcohol dehydrogenase family)
MRSVLVTGGIKRIGLEISKKLASAGWHVIAHYNTSHDHAQALASWAESESVRVDCIQANLSLPEQAEKLLPRCTEQFGPLSCLINNASQFELDFVETITYELFTSHFATNVYAPAILSQKFFDSCSREDPVIINLLDQKVENLNPDFLSYTLSMCALYSLTKILAVKWADRIRVCGIAPGLALISGNQTLESFERAWAATPLGRSTTPGEIANAVVFLLNTRGITGTTIFLDGGESLARRSRDVAFDISTTKGDY